MNRPKQHRVRRHEGRRAVEPQHRHALHVILARLAQADVVVERQHALAGHQGEERAVQVDLLLQGLGREEQPRVGGCGRGHAQLISMRTPGRLQGRERDVEDAPLDVGVVLDVEDEDAVPAGGEDGGDALHEEGEERRQEALLGHVLQTHRDAVGQHVVCYDGDPEGAEGGDLVNAVCGESKTTGSFRVSKRSMFIGVQVVRNIGNLLTISMSEPNILK